MPVLPSPSPLSTVALWGDGCVEGNPELIRNSARSGLSRPVLLVVFILVTGLLIIGGFSLYARMAADATNSDDTRDYSQIADQLNLQSDPEILQADENWRERVGIDSSDSDDTDSSFGFLSGITIVMIIWALIWLIAAGILSAIIYLIWRYGSVIQVGTRGEAAAGETADGVVEAGPALANEEKTPTLDAVLAIEDEAIAIGALQRLVLETALASINATLRKSETARAVLRRLPHDWRHYDPVATLVRLAERVRFAGEHLDREGLIAAVEDARPILRDAKGRT